MRNQHLRFSSLFGTDRTETAPIDSKYEFIAPWVAVDPKHVEGMCGELQKEVAEGHILHGLQCVPIGHRRDCDETVWEVSGADFSFATVHLTFRKETNPKWPNTETFSSFLAFETSVMKPDNQEFEAE